MIVNEEFLNKLRRAFGLNLYEVKLWAALLSRGVSTAGELSDIADVPPSLPTLVLPNLRLVPDLLIPAITIGIIGLVQGAGVSQSFPNPGGKFSDTSRDFFGQGAANLAAGIFGGIPAGGSSSGTALIVSAGARPRWANIFGGIAVAIGVLLFSNLVELVELHRNRLKAWVPDDPQTRALQRLVEFRREVVNQLCDLLLLPLVFALVVVD
jgi:hypothetical protein